MPKARRVAWDACTWIAAISDETALLPGGGTEHRGALCRYTLGLAQQGSIEIATSGLSLAEVCKNKGVRSEDGDTLSDFFRNEYILIVPVDRAVGTLARQIMQAGPEALKAPDAIHLATAIRALASEFHTFDRQLLQLDGKLEREGGGFLSICKPPAPPPNLFD